MHIVYSDKHRLHVTDHVLQNGQPFISEDVPARAEIILEAIKSAKLGILQPPTDHGIQPLLAVHDPEYLKFLQQVYIEYTDYYHESAPVFPETFASRHPRRKPNHSYWLMGYYAYGVGSPILEGTWTAAYWSVQCALTASDLVRKNNRNITCRVAYAICRPPGHHAAVDQYGGLCYLNNAAIAARYLQNVSPHLTEGSGRKTQIAILDIDYHHGNGTQEIFYSDPSVLFCSLHAHPDNDYPYFWGAEDEIGEKEGQGYNHNWTLPPGTDDISYLNVLELALDTIRGFNADYLVISVGFDTAVGDPIGEFKLTTAGFAEIGRRISNLKLPTVITQEGGYLLDQLGMNAVAFLSPFENNVV
jgi:acetoin utilization deacetylase AcuC-like enzyme